MFKKKKGREPPKAFDIHRTLPKHYHKHDVDNWSTHTQIDPQTNRLPGEGFDGEPPEQEEKPKRKRLRKIKWTFLLLALLFLVSCFLILFLDARNFAHASKKMFGTSNMLNLVKPTSLKSSDQGRVNVLVVGYSVDDPAHPGANLTDSIMLLSMSTTNHTGYMLSIPRDLYVKIPGFGYGKINEAYEDGGMSLLEQIVSQDLQVPINYYALVDYSAVRDTVNALGGVSVNIQSPDSRGLFDPNISPVDGGPLRLSNGVQTINGQTALNLTRARGDPCGCGQYSYGFPQSDFNRTQNQRMVFTAIKDRLSNLGWTYLLNPWKNKPILDAMASNVKTDLKLSEVRPLYHLFTGIPSNQLKSESLNNLDGQNLLRSTYYEGDTLSPAAGAYNFSQIDAAITQLNQ